ncbi:MAG TPA: hypothetical protein EYP60_04360 [bacterium (Candidatus Stahlbacteria)]|nr:hypothetical protein [Candidatus Stahlbacteria bacterium]
MKAVDFDAVVEERIEKINDVLADKGAEYESEDDRLHNFKKAGEILEITPESACLGMQAKHVVSVLDLVDTVDSLKEDEYLDITKDYISEKIGDAINYYILLEALLYERLDSQKTEEE